MKTPRLRVAALWIVVSSFAGCHGCTCGSVALGVGKHRVVPSLWVASRCGPGKGCPAADAACPQGYACTFAENIGGPSEPVCRCRSENGAQCSRAADCTGAWCHLLWNCAREPGSRVGTCECRAECDDTHPCGDDARCERFPWGDAGFCRSEGGGR
jgi:hypothetical protein